MNKKYKLLILVVLLAVLSALAFNFFRGADIAVLNPQGQVAERERNLIYFTLALSLIVVIPVFVLTTIIAWRYREGNSKAKYSPDLDHNLLAETMWWLIPTVLIVVLSVVTWRSSHQLDPAMPLASSNKSMRIQVVAMNWKWLFIYPQQNIASVNLVQIPINTPVDFEITSDAPMNSFWIPQLGSQIYAMAGMSTHLHLEASRAGDFKGSSANISGEGFSDMNFIARASSQADFELWVGSVKNSANYLSLTAYNQLARPSRNNQVAYYAGGDSGLFGNIMLKFMMPGMEGYIQ